MKISSIFIALIFLSILGCAQNDNHNFHLAGKIPIDAKRWYQVTNAKKGLEELFDNNQYEKPNTGYNKLVTNYDAWYALKEGEQMTIDSIMFFCWRGIDASHPLTIYTISADWQRTPVAIFTGQRANSWLGPDPAHPDNFALKSPVSGFKYLVINSWGEFPGEIEFYGKYQAPTPQPTAVVTPAALRNFFGINAYEWDFETSANPMVTDEKKLSAISNFTGVRHYLDWEKLEPTEGKYTFSPARNGSWNYDTIYQWCKGKNIDVLACIKTIPKWIETTYPEGKRNNENVPARYGKDLSEPGSYIEQARLAFQFAARYGSNKGVDVRLVKVDTTLRWKGDNANRVRIGMNTIKYIECDNERDKWWKGRTAYQTGREYAANLSAFYDGDKGRLGPGVGVKAADSNVKVVMAGLADPKTDYVKAVIDWSRQYRGLRTDGSVDVPFDIINYHYYSNDGDDAAEKEQTVGIAPELTPAARIASDFVTMAHEYASDKPVWVTEAGYDINPKSVQRAVAINGKTIEQTQADWILRTSLLYARSGIQKLFFYQLHDDNATSTQKYGTSGLVNENNTKRPATDYLHQVSLLFGSYSYKTTIATDPIVDEYIYGDKIMYALVVPDTRGRVASFTLDLGSADSAYIYTPTIGPAMKLEQLKSKNGTIKIAVTETPVFVTAKKQ